ncbi:SH3 domain-containing protein [Jiangella gansuensis]|uniref:SH3 domain-containing protein n=1 Tax=Jiangella gansuensis TaxID=281473 RepID=UPI0004B9F94B|nr:SH3 domain-containing protein [Jiangella gansuensis]
MRVGEHDTTWPAFVFVTFEGGSGCVPERHLDAARPVATVLRGYTTQELPAVAGAEVTVLEDDPESGWSWCEDAEGRTGWVPHSCFRPA